MALFEGFWRCDAIDGATELIFSSTLDMGIPSLADALEPIAVRTLIDNTVSIISGLFGASARLATDSARAGNVGARPMRFLETERGCLESFLPGLDKYLAETPLHELERRGNGALATFREVNGPGLLVPTEFGGAGASLLEAVRIQRAIGSRSPSLAVATTMHHFSVASLVELTAVGEGFEWAMLTAIAENSWLLSSGFAEGKPGQHILSPGMVGVRVDGGLRVSGRKRPCSLTWSMNLMSASVRVVEEGSDLERMAIILIPAESEGIVRREFWQSWALAGAESDEVELNDVFVPEALVFYPETGDSMDPIQARGFVYFELLIAAAYLGAVSGLAEKVITSQKVSAEERALMAIELESAAAGLEYVAMLFQRRGEQ